jgi:5-dehydro-2-deoxygluconokinase
MAVSGQSRISDGLRRNDFVILGRAGFDLFTDAGVALEQAGHLNLDLGGSAANIAAGLCKLGGRSALVTRLSDDSIGSYCLARLRHYGVDTRHVTRIGGEFRSSLAVYESVTENHRTVIYRNGASDLQMDAADVAAVDYRAFGALVAAGTVFACEPSRGASFLALERARAAGLPVVLDVDYRPYSWTSPRVAAEIMGRAAAASDVIVGNDDEFGLIAGDHGRGLDKARELAASGAAIVVYKMGERGAVTMAGGREIRTGIYAVTAVKPTGAGDSFLAGLLNALALGHDLEAAVLRGSACAAICVSRPGCAPAMPDLAELEAFLARHPGPTAT